MIPRPDHVRTLRGTPFGWLDARLLRGGWLRRLPPESLLAYVFLCLAADRHGVSYYRRSRISDELGLDDQRLHRGLARLHELELVAYAPFYRGAEDGYHQVLPLPSASPPPSSAGSLLTGLASRLERRFAPERLDRPE